MVIIIATNDRKALTGITLESVMQCKAPATRVVVMDDHSTEYDTAWLKTFGVEVWKHDSHGVGRMAWSRLEVAYDFTHVGGEDIVLALDNDMLATPGFDTRTEAAYRHLRAAHPTGALIFSPYRSTLHEGTPELGYDHMTTIGGASMAMDGHTTRLLLDRINEWDTQWDYRVSAHALCYAPRRSWLEHIGRHTGGANAPSIDKGLNFIGYA